MAINIANEMRAIEQEKSNDFAPLVSIVVVNYKNVPVTRDLLKSLREVTYPCVEIIVVDNKSDDDIAETLPEEFPEIKLILSQKNLGYAGGNNLGIRASRGDLILVINNDVEVTPGFLEPLVEVFDRFPLAGMVSPKIVYHGSNRIQYAGSTGINPWTGRGKKIAHLKEDDGAFDYTAETELIHGACMMFSRRLVEEAGLIPEIYFLYYEELDWAQEAMRKGFKLYYAGASKIYHKASSTIGKESPLQTYHMARNRLIYMRRNVDNPAFIGSMLFFILFSIPVNLMRYMMKGDSANGRAFVRGVAWHFGHNPVRTDQAGAHDLFQHQPERSQQSLK